MAAIYSELSWFNQYLEKLGVRKSTGADDQIPHVYEPGTRRCGLNGNGDEFSSHLDHKHKGTPGVLKPLIWLHTLNRLYKLNAAEWQNYKDDYDILS